MKGKRKIQLFLLLLLLCTLDKKYLFSSKKLQKMYQCWSVNKPPEELQLSDWYRPKASLHWTSNWSAPVVWHDNYNEDVLEKYYANHKVTVGLTVFAVGSYVKSHLGTFLSTADRHFMVGQRVIIYVMTDNLASMPWVPLSLGRTIKVFQIERQKRWQDISMMRMKTLSEHLAAHIRHEVDFLFCMDVDLVFQQDFGPETLGESVAQIHAYWYNRNASLWPYERSGRSAASMASGEGDFYYHAALFGGTPSRMLHLTSACFQGIMRDKKNGVEAVWHDESHLNKYFFLHKPSKLLSPEYCWDFHLNKETDVNVIKVYWALKELKDDPRTPEF